MAAASAGETSEQAPEMETRPITNPFALMEASGLPKRIPVTINAVSRAMLDATRLFTAISAMLWTPAPANSIAPAVSSPSHPVRVNMQPNRTKTMLCPGIAIPLASYLPWRGPRIQVMDSAVKPPTAWITPAPPASMAPLPHAASLPNCASQPPPHTQWAKIG